MILENTLAAKRISQLAKELGIESKAILAKCRAEGIPDTVVKGHASTVSAGLEASIREWFSGQGGVATATETSEKIDVSTVRAKPRRRTGKSDDHGTHEDDGEMHAAEPDTAGTIVVPERSVEPKAEPRPSPAKDEPKEEPAAAPAKPKAPASSQTPTLRPTVLAPAPPPPPAPPAKEREPAPVTLRPAAVTPPAPASKPAPMNVPTRPTVVSPAGPKLETRAPVKLSGPKVVRVEAPEVIEPPRPRRAPGPGSSSGGASGPARPGRPMGESDDDRGRSPRRKQGAGAGAGAGAPGARSSGTGVPARRRASSGTEWVGGQIFSEQDLVEREARLLRAGGFLKKRRTDLKRADDKLARADESGPDDGKVYIAAPFTIKDLSAATGVKGADIVKKLFLQGVMATINSGIDPLKAAEIMIDFDIDLQVTEAKTAEEAVSADYEEREMVDQRPCGPVVTILGHVDHGKTSLLDKIRNANVAAGEAGGITQRTSAFRVEVEVAGEKKNIVFLDTPGHEAFTSMRSRGAKMTDVVVLVVSAPEGVMPQTIESINHAKAAGVPIVVALNKIDRPDATEAQVQKTLRQLADAGLNPVEWGGDTEVVRTSATTGTGIPELLETLDYQAQLLQLKADFGGQARGSVIESKSEEGRGAVANLLVQDGRLAVGDFVVAGRAFGRVRDITDDRGQKLKEVFPPMPVQISGIDEMPDAGDRFFVVDSLKEAQEAAEQRRHREREAQLAQPKVTLDSLFTQMADKSVKEILIVLKAAEQGTVDVLKSECEKVGTAEVKVKVLHGAVGGINESDVLLADASKAIIIGFNVIPSGKARTMAEQKHVEIRSYQVIYDITGDLKKAAEGMLAPEIRQEILGHADVRKVFTVTKVGKVAGCYVTDGSVQRDALIRVTRAGIVIENDRKLEQLKRVKDDAKEVRAGMECGMKIVGYDDIKEGDVLECYKQVEVKRTL